MKGLTRCIFFIIIAAAMLCLLVFTDGFKDWSFSHKPWEGGPDKDKVRVEWIGFEENEIIFGETEQ